MARTRQKNPNSGPGVAPGPPLLRAAEAVERRSSVLASWLPLKNAEVYSSRALRCFGEFQQLT